MIYKDLVSIGSNSPRIVSAFPGILNWQKRIWMTVHDYRLLRTAIQPGQTVPDTDEFQQQDRKLWDARNYFSAGATFNYKFSHQLSVGISKQQGLTNAIRRSSPEVVAFGRQYERAMAAQIIMLAPMAPHFASELWEQFRALPHRLNPSSEEIQWDRGVFEQSWPTVDEDYALDLTFKVSEVGFLGVERSEETGLNCRYNLLQYKSNRLNDERSKQ